MEIDHLLLKGRAAIMVKICCLFLLKRRGAAAVPISGLLLGAATSLRGQREKRATTVRKLSVQLAIKPCPLYPTLAQGGV